MDIQKILKTVENGIATTHQREYFLIHEARYAYILKQISHIQRSLTGPAAGFPPRPPTEGTPAGGGPPARVTRKRLRVLDVGCFPYHLGAALEQMNCDVYGISSSHEPIKSGKIKICNIETDTFPFKDNFFDLVVCTEVLEHLPQSPAHAIREMRRVTKPRGFLLLTTPNIARSINRAKLLLGKTVMYPLSQVLENDGAGSNLYHRHNREYTLKELTTLLTHEHWNVETATHFVSYTPFRRRIIPDSLLLKSGKVANYILMIMVSGLRDTLFVLGRK